MAKNEATPQTEKNEVSFLPFYLNDRKEPLSFGFDGTNFSKIFGDVLKAAMSTPFIFTLFGCKITVPAGNKSPQQRFIFVAEILVKAIFAGMEDNEVLKDEDKVKFVMSLQGLFKFSHLTKNAVLQAIKVKKDRISQLAGLQKEATNNLNRAFITDTETIKEARKIVKEKGNEAARLYLASKKVAGIPVMLKIES